MAPKRPSSPGPLGNGTSSSKSAATANRERARQGLTDGGHGSNGADANDERGEFEDAWEDEFEEEEIASNYDEDDDEDEDGGRADGAETGVEGQVDGERSLGLSGMCFDDLRFSNGH